MRASSAALLLLLSTLLTGCWSRLEVNDAAVVLALAADKGVEEPVRLTLYIARPGGQGQGGQDGQPGAQATPVWLASHEAGNLSDALREIAQASSRRIILDHLRVALIGGELAKEGVDDFLDFLIRHPEVRMTVRLMTVRDYRAAEVLQMEPVLEGLMSEQLAGILPARGGPLLRLKEVAVAQVSHAHSPWMEEITLSERWHQRDGSPPLEVYFVGAALFKGGRLTEQLDRRQTQGLNWLLNKPNQSNITAPCPDEPDRTFSGEVTSGKAKIEPVLAGDRVTFHVRVRGAVDLERKPCMAALLSPQELSSYEQALNEDLANRLTETIAKMQRTGVDPAGFGKRVELKYSRDWQELKKRWPEVWQESKVTVDVDLEITYSGLLIRPPLFDTGRPD